MSNTFIHSVKVPRLYKVTAKTVENVAENGASLKQLIYEKKHPNIAGSYALALTTLRHASELNELLRKTQLLFKEPRLDPWLARVLMTELLWGKKVILSEAKPVKTIVSYHSDFLSELNKLESSPDFDAIGSKVKRPRYVRINTLATTVQDAISAFEAEEWILLAKSPDYSSFLKTISTLDGSQFAQDFHIPELLVFPSGTHFFDHASYLSSAIALQDKASCLPSYLLNVTPGSTVLDLCAAPGMKTTHLAAIMENSGKIYAVERDAKRYGTLCKLIADNGATCVEAFNEDAMTADSTKFPDVEYILVDPSCSGSGLWDRPLMENPHEKCPPGRLQKLQSFQSLLLRHALLSFPSAKRVVYSTCSTYPEENEMVIDEILGNIGKSYKLLSLKKLLAGNWNNFSSKDYTCKNKCLYARSDTDFTNGFFVAVFERNFDVPLPEYKREKAFTNGNRKEKMNVRQHEDANGGANFPTKKQKKKSNGESLKDHEVSMINGEVKDDLLNGEAKDDLPKEEAKDEGEENITKKKSKKKKKISLDMSESITTTEDVSEKHLDDKMEKKKRKREVPSTEISVINDSPIDGEVEKKKKKKKKHLESEQETIDSPLDIEVEKKKKKKKKHLESEQGDSSNVKVEDSENLSSEEPKKEKKKKKKKKSSIGTMEDAENRR